MNRKMKSLFALWCLNLTALVTQFSASTYYAADAVADIMNNERFQGAVSTIEWLTTKIDYWFTMAITLAAFFIISTAMLKNVLAGAYCANTKFWNAVAQAHEKSDAATLAGMFQGFKNFQQISPASLKDSILGIIPNIKAMTDFDDAEIEPKAYWMKAIPQMVGCVIIGVFIYNGYYRDVAVLTGNIGSEVLTRVFSSIEPVALIDTITQTSKKAANIFEGDPSIQGQMCFTISEELYKVALADCKGQTSEEFKTSIMRDAENAAYIHLNKLFRENNQDLRVFNESDRIYDYTVSGLKITTIGTSDSVANNILDGQYEEGYSGIITRSKLDKASDDDSVLNVTSYVTILPTADSYTNNLGYYITYQLKGEKSDGTKLAATSNTPSSGDWTASKLGSITMTVTQGNGKTEVVIPDVMTDTTANQQVLVHITAAYTTSGESLPTGFRITECAINGYDNTGGRMRVQGMVIDGSTVNPTKAEYVVTCRDSEGNTYRYQIPIDLIVRRAS